MNGYFDNSSATPPSKEALAAASDATNLWQCLSAPYMRDSSLKGKLDGWYQTVHSFLGMRTSDLAHLTSSSSESVAHIVNGIVKDVVQGQGKNQVIHLAIDEASIILPLADAEELHIVNVPVEGTRLTADLIKPHLNARTAMISLSWGHGLTGIINPLHEIAELAEQHGVLLHVDATEVVGKLYFSFQDIPIDYLTIDGARIHAPYGTGLLVQRKGSELPAFIPDSMQQNGMRGGVFNMPGFAGFTTALAQLEQYTDHMCTEMIRLRDVFEQQLTALIPDIHFHFTDVERLPHISCFSLPGIHGDHLQHALQTEGIYASRGGGIHQRLDRVLELCNVPRFDEAIQFSFSREHTEQDITFAVQKLHETYTKLCRGMLTNA